MSNIADHKKIKNAIIIQRKYRENKNDINRYNADIKKINI